MAKITMTTTDHSDEVTPHVAKEIRNKASIVGNLAKPVRDGISVDFDAHMHYIPTSSLFGVKVNPGDTENG